MSKDRQTYDDCWKRSVAGRSAGFYFDNIATLTWPTIFPNLNPIPNLSFVANPKNVSKFKTIYFLGPKRIFYLLSKI